MKVKWADKRNGYQLMYLGHTDHDGFDTTTPERDLYLFGFISGKIKVFYCQLEML